MNNTDNTLPLNGENNGEPNYDTAPLIKELRADMVEFINLTKQRWERDDAFQGEVRQRWTRDDEFQAEVRLRLREIEIQVGLLRKDQFRIRTDAADLSERVERLERRAS